MSLQGNQDNFRKIETQECLNLTKDDIIYLKGLVTGKYYPVKVEYYSSMSGVMAMDDFGNQNFYSPDRIYQLTTKA